MREPDPKIQDKLRKLERELKSRPTIADANTPPAKERQIGNRFAIPFYFLAIAWGQQVIDQIIFAGRWNLPIIPRHMSGLPGALFSIFSHADFAHLAANSIPFILFSWLVLMQSYRDYWITLLVGWLGGGFLCWLLGPSPVHGLSGVVYTLFGYLLWIGWQERRVIPLAISVFVLVNYRGFLWWVLPQDPRVAWWGHLIGFMLGIGTAYLLGKNQQKDLANKS